MRVESTNKVTWLEKKISAGKSYFLVQTPTENVAYCTRQHV